jgi:hypothetical protein
MNPFLKKIWDLLPKFVQDSAATFIDKASGNTIPEPISSHQTQRPIRVFISPANYAGQGYQWARAIEENTDVYAQNLVYAENNPFGYDADYTVRWRTVTHSRHWQKKHLEALSQEFTHVLVEAEFPPLGGMFNENVKKQIEVLRSFGLTVGMICHGSDIRLPSRHREHEKWSPFVNDDWVPVKKLEKVMLKNRQLLDDIDAPTFVSTAGLLLDVPYAHFLPVVIAPEKWKTEALLFSSNKLKVAHIPSNPLVKGTAEIQTTLTKLENEGLIEYIQISGVSQEDMPTLFQSCDVVLDQFRLGDYGVAACEAMAAGRLVISHVSNQVRDVIKKDTGLDLPIVEANIVSLESVLRDVFHNTAQYRDHADRGPEFVSVVHNGNFSRLVLEKYFLNFELSARKVVKEK